MSARPIPVEAAGALLTDLIQWFEHPEFPSPDATMPDYGQRLAAMPIADDHGILARTNVLVSFDTADTHPDWFLRIGQALKVIAANQRGFAPRQAVLSIRARRPEQAPDPTDAVPEIVRVEGGRQVAAPVVASAPPVGFSVLIDVIDSRPAAQEESKVCLN